MCVLAVLAALAVAACGSGSEPRAIAEQEPLSGGSFEASVKRGAGGLDVSYRVANDSGASLLVLNRVPVQEAPAGTPLATDPAQVYVTHRGGGLVEVAKRTFTRPEGVELYAPWELEMTVLGPGRSLEESFTVPLPLEGRSLYPEHDGGLAQLPDPVEAVAFCVGVVPPPPGVDVGAHGSVFRDGHGLRGQRLLCSDQVDVRAA
ncbi:MAG: hypothetical protein KY454_04755 [Actinobacteria bacterium]|nr:hypothetical protein [Actinomycetota bacterium]